MRFCKYTKSFLTLSQSYYLCIKSRHFGSKNKISRPTGSADFVYHGITTLLCQVLGDDAGSTAYIFGAGTLAVILRSARRGHRGFVTLGNRL